MIVIIPRINSIITKGLELEDLVTISADSDIPVLRLRWSLVKDSKKSFQFSL